MNTICLLGESSDVEKVINAYFKKDGNFYKSIEQLVGWLGKGFRILRSMNHMTDVCPVYFVAPNIDALHLAGMSMYVAKRLGSPCGILLLDGSKTTNHEGIPVFPLILERIPHSEVALEEIIRGNTRFLGLWRFSQHIYSNPTPVGELIKTLENDHSQFVKNSRFY